MIDGQPSKSPRLLVVALYTVLVLAIMIVVWLLAQRPAVSPSNPSKNSNPSAQAKVQLALFATGISNPAGIVSTGIAEDKRLFVLDQSGKIRIVNSSGTVINQPFLDLSDTVMFEGEMGLLGLAFSPEYATDGYFYVNYIDRQQNTVVARYHISKDANIADTSTAQIVLKQPQPYKNHNGGALAFGPDGYLYIAFGDGGSAGDPENRAQDMGTWLGKILRIDVSKLPYVSPTDNPFAGQGGVKQEIWSSGLRDPWRMSFDSKTHELYIADVGQDAVEEIDVEAPGKGGNNYGWRCYEGDRGYKTAGCNDRSKYAFPVLAYDHSAGRCSITGGYVYRGTLYPDLSGKYFYGDYCGGQVYAMEKKDSVFTATLAVQTPYKISTFGQDSGGELYLADYGSGSIYKLQDAQ